MKHLGETTDDIIVTAALTPAQRRHIERRAKDGQLQRIFKGLYVAAAGGPDDVARRVSANWARVAGVIAPGGVISHASAMSGRPIDGMVYVSHPTLGRRKVRLPGLTVEIVPGCGPLAGDVPMSNTGLHYAGHTRFLLENLGMKLARKAGADAVERYLVMTLNASGEKALNRIRDEAAIIASALGLQGEAASLRELVAALLGTHKQGTLKTQEGILIAKGMPVDAERMMRFDALASHLRIHPFPRFEEGVPSGVPRHNFCFVESYFSNYVEGTKFAIEEAREIVLNNRISVARPKDSHDVLGVFRLALTPPFRNSPPVAGEDFLPGLEQWHTAMLGSRPEANPGRVKTEQNYAGTTAFVRPSHVRGTLEAGSKIALSVPEGVARAVFYAFLVSEVHPFDDGNGRLSRLVMNAELSRVGLHRIIVPTLFHPQYVDCVRKLTRSNEPEAFARCLAMMARWCSQFDYTDMDALIAALRTTNAMEESPAQYQLLNLDGSKSLQG